MPSRPVTAPSRPRRLDRFRRVKVVLATILTLGAVLAGPATVHAAPTTTDRVILIGTGGLTWADITPEATPAIWSLADRGAIGNLVVRSVNSTTCPADGWLAVNTGKRAADAFNAKSVNCRELENAEVGEGSAVPAWSEYLEQLADQSYSAIPGALGDAVQASMTTATAIGPGAAIALSTNAGQVAGAFYPGPQGTAPIPEFASIGADVTDALDTSALIVVDVGSVRTQRHSTEPKPVPELTEAQEEALDAAADAIERADEADAAGAVPAVPTSAEVRIQDLRTVDYHVAQVLTAVEADDPGLSRTTIILASVSDPATTSRLGVAAMAGVGVATGTLTSQSTHQPGFVQTTDLLPTVGSFLDLADAFPRGALVGSAITSDGVDTATATRVNALADAELHARSTYPLVERFFMFYCVINLALFAAVSLGFSSPFVSAAARAAASTATQRRGILNRLAPAITSMPGVVLLILRASGIAIAAMPVSTLLANLAPWWRADSPGTVLTALIFGWMVAITAVAVVPPWRTWLFGPVTIVATLTAAVLAFDVATGATMQVSALMGIQPVVAGRFYGFNNTSFALFATTTILVAAAVSNWFVTKGQRRTAAWAVVAIGILAIALDGSPLIGADFGGPPALVPAFAILALMAAGIAVTWRRVAIVLGGATVVVIGFSVIDWLRPAADRTHLGAFIDTVLDGGLWEIVWRKIDANISTLRSPLAIVGVSGLLVIVLVLGRPLRAASKSSDTSPYDWLTGGTPLKQISTDAPMFTPGIISAGVALGIGTLVNDSGVVVLGVGISVLVPLATATYASWMLTLRRSGRPSGAGMDESAST